MLAAGVLLTLYVGGPLELDWRAPEGCPDAAAVAEDLAGLTDLSAAPATVRVRARTRRQGERYALDLSIRAGRHGLRRRLVTDQCDTLAEATALLIAIVVDPRSLAGDAPVTALPLPRDLDPGAPLAIPGPEEVVTPPVELPSPAPAAAEDAPPPRLPKSAAATVGLLRIEGGIDTGATPGPAGDLVLGGGIVRRRLRAELHGLYTPARPLTLGDDEVGRLSRWAIGARICAMVLPWSRPPPPRSRGIEGLVCGGVEGGQLRAAGSGVTVERLAAHPPWLGVLAGIGLLWAPIPRIAVGARVDAVFAPIRAQFAVADRLVHVVDPVGVRATLGVELRLGPALDRRRR